MFCPSVILAATRYYNNYIVSAFFVTETIVWEFGKRHVYETLACLTASLSDIILRKPTSCGIIVLWYSH